MDIVFVIFKGSYVVINLIRVRKSVKLFFWDIMYSVEEEKIYRSYIVYTAIN